jgi:hypothetical protein
LKQLINSNQPTINFSVEVQSLYVMVGALGLHFAGGFDLAGATPYCQEASCTL